MSQKAQALLLEIGAEELPAAEIEGAARQLSQGLCAALGAGGLEHGDCQEYATPRRLAVLVQKVARSRPARSNLRVGPPLAKAKGADGEWNAAAKGFARSCGAAVDELQVVEEGGVERVACEAKEPELPASELLPDMVRQAVTRLGFARGMRWGACEQPFLRPVRWLLLLHGKEPVPLEMFGVKSSNLSHGHRQHHPQAIVVEHPDQWQQQLLQAKVVACMQQRMQIVREQLEDVAKKAACALHAPERLLREVNFLVEWPVAVHGSFDESYLQMPEEILLSVMQKHQRCFPLYQDDSKRRLAPAFIAVAGLESSDANVVARGNENVLRPRLSDAEFFWQRDCKEKLEDRLGGLEKIIYHSKLGSVAERSRQVAAAAADIAAMLGLDQGLARRAGLLCKCDLVCDTVNEFPELQGKVGALLAARDGEPEQVAQAIAGHYQPIDSTDGIAAAPIARAVALADKLNLVAGIFSVGEMPSADKDPFAVRRAAIGALRTLLEADIDAELGELLAIAMRPFSCEQPVDRLMEFFAERLRAICVADGAMPQVVDAALAVAAGNPSDLRKRVSAMHEFIKVRQSEQLIAAHKRVRNILRQAAASELPPVKEKLLAQPEERELARQLAAQRQKCAAAVAKRDYQAALRELAALQPALEPFFDQVKVMADEPEVRGNRLALLASLESAFNMVADLTRLDG